MDMEDNFGKQTSDLHTEKTIGRNKRNGLQTSNRKEQRNQATNQQQMNERKNKNGKGKRNELTNGKSD